MSLAAEMVRKYAARGDDKRDAGCTTPEDVLRFDHIRYGTDETWHQLDVYRPRGEKDLLPVIVSVHGGGWVYGDKSRYQYYCMSLARQGFAVVNYSYRLAPRHKFPAPVEDTCMVFQWLSEHSREYGFDCGNVFAVGDSAGAHILAMYCCACTDPDYARQLSLQTCTGLLPKAVALNCGVYRINTRNQQELTTRLMEDYLPEKGTPEELSLMDLLTHLTPAFPPAFVMTALGDFLAYQAKPLADRLKDLGVPVRYRCYGGRDQTLEHVFHLKIRTPAAQECNREECDFFKERRKVGQAGE